MLFPALLVVRRCKLKPGTRKFRVPLFLEPIMAKVIQLAVDRKELEIREVETGRVSFVEVLAAFNYEGKILIFCTEDKEKSFIEEKLAFGGDLYEILGINKEDDSANVYKLPPQIAPTIAAEIERVLIVDHA
jgi:hypothetical protein